MRTDRRKAPRFTACYPLEFESGTGITVDLSATGISFVTRDVEIGPGEVVSFKILLDDEEAPELKCLHAHGRVVRNIEREDAYRDVAIELESFFFESASEVSH